MAQPFSREQLSQIFRQIDTDNSGKLSANELQLVLSNGSWSPFNIMTVQAMINLYSSGDAIEVTFEQFVRLWAFIENWQRFFKAADKDNSGCIDLDELRTAITNSGYRLSDSMFRLMMWRYDRHKKGVIYFDDFIHLCITLQKLTEQFRNLDTDRDGFINIQYETYLYHVFLAFT